jgi:hypothetical protein
MRRMVLAVLFLTLATPAQAERGFASKDEVGRWMTNYYLKPEPERLAVAVSYMSHSGMLDKSSTATPLGGFLSGVFHANPVRVPGWLDSMGRLPEEQLPGVLIGIRFAGLPDSRARAHRLLQSHAKLQEQLGSLDTLGATTLEQITLEGGAPVLDALWGRFMATGDRAPVERVIEALPFLDAKDDEWRQSIGGAAGWSLTSNAVQHPRVLEVCEAVALNQKSGESAHLREVIATAKERLAKGVGNKLPTAAREAVVP